ncbi:MAG: hypothetical protein ACD_73C00253G0003 [uncultured bacterium]|nr:MAG: hypothetical protein ACD_73C00253G0003 [uncultured bacterium]
MDDSSPISNSPAGTYTKLLKSIQVNTDPVTGTISAMVSGFSGVGVASAESVVGCGEGVIVTGGGVVV